jgi:hypothetical protein
MEASLMHSRWCYKKKGRLLKSDDLKFSTPSFTEFHLHSITLAVEEFSTLLVNKDHSIPCPVEFFSSYDA